MKDLPLSFMRYPVGTKVVWTSPSTKKEVKGVVVSYEKAKEAFISKEAVDKDIVALWEDTGRIEAASSCDVKIFKERKLPDWF